jgi:hypothetical protein
VGAQGCERGVQVSLVGLLAPVTSRPAFSRTCTGAHVGACVGCDRAPTRPGASSPATARGRRVGGSRRIVWPRPTERRIELVRPAPF